jgi:hypothetical protein
VVERNQSKAYKRLFLKEIERIPSIKVKDLPIFKNLESKVLNGVPSSVLFVSFENLLTLLLSSPSLSFVELRYCDNLTGEILQQANDFYTLFVI